MAVELPSLTTPRLILRPFESADGSDVERLAGAWEVADTTLNIPHPYPEGAGARWINTHAAAWASGSSLTLAIALRATPKTLIGAVSLAIAREHARGELGYWIAVAHQGQGLGRLALDDAIAVARSWPADQFAWMRPTPTQALARSTRSAGFKSVVASSTRRSSRVLRILTHLAH